MATDSGTSAAKYSINYVKALINSLIVSGVALFSTTGLISSGDFWIVGLKAVGLSFFTQLAIEVGIKYSLEAR
jgi:hypothetical protein